MSSSPHNQPSESGSSDPKLQFKAENIGQWTGKQEDPFAAQNRAKEAKKQKSTATFKKFRPYLIIAGIVIAVGLVVWGIVALVRYIQLESLQREGDYVSVYSNVLQELYDAHDGSMREKYDAVVERVQEDIDKTTNNEEINELRLAQAFFYNDNDFCMETIRLLENDVDPDLLPLVLQISYYESLYYAYVNIGEDETANTYFIKAYDLRADLKEN